MFNVVIEKENHSDIDSLIIREDINNIIQSIEEQLYNINVSYRNNVRKIKNSLKSLEGISESSLIILENENVNDENLISYLTNVLEISLDCIVSTLYENKEYRSLLKNVNDINSLLNIDSQNTKIFKNILEQYEDLFNVYSQVNEIEISSTSFYELLDKSIENSVNAQSKYIPEDVKTEVDIYNKVIENLDSLVTNDLVTTYDNIKVFAASQVKQVNEGFLTNTLFPWLVRNIQGFGATNPLRLLGGLGIIFTSIVSIVWHFTGKGIDLINNVYNTYFRDILTEFDWGDVAPTIKTIIDNKEYNLSENDYIQLMKYYNELGVSELDQNKKEALTHIFSKFNVQGQFTEKFAAFNEKMATADNVQQNLNAMQNLNRDIASTFDTSKSELDGFIEKLKALTTPFKEEAQSLATEIDEIKYLAYGGIGASLISALLIIGFLYKSRLPSNFKSEVSKFTNSMIFVEKSITKLKDRALQTFPELKIQFNLLDSEINKCKDYSSNSKDPNDLTSCLLKNTIGTYSIILYFALIQLKKDGNDLSKFTSLSDVQNFNGFSSFKTKLIVSELNSAYSIIIKNNPELVKSFIIAFDLIKRDIIENNPTDIMISRILPKF